MKFKLPPMLEDVLPDGQLKWRHFEDHGFEDVGHFLSCHLIIEHYLECHLKTKSSDLDWENGKLTFAQKISLLGKESFPEDYNFLPLLKHFNSIRNKLSHSLDYKISSEDIQPFKNFLLVLRENRKKEADEIILDSEEMLQKPQEIISTFTMMVCAFLAGSLTAYWKYLGKYKRG